MKTINRRMNFKLAIFVMLLLVLAGIAIVMAKHCLPVYDGDAAWFMPVSINAASGYGFRNDWFPNADHEGLGRMVWHGYLGNLLAGKLLWQASYPALFMFQALTAIVILILTGLIFYKVIPKPGSKGYLGSTLMACVLLAGLLPSFFSGRPEPFATLMVVLTVLTLQHTQMRYHGVLIGVGLALVAVAQPTVALIGIPVSGIYLACRFCPRRMLVESAKAGLCALGVTVLATMLLHPFGLSDWIRGVLHHGQRTHGYWSESLLWFWFLLPDRFAYGVWFLTAFCALAVFFFRQSMGKLSRSLIVLFGAVTLVAIWRFGIWVPATNYNVIAYAPVICLALVYVVIVVSQNKAMPAMMRWCGIIVLVALSAMPLVGMLRFVLHPIASRGIGVPFHVARQRLHELLEDHPVVGVTYGFFTLADDQRRIELVRHVKQVTEPTAIMIQQANSGRHTPPDVAGYVLKEDAFAKQPPTLLGFRTGNTPTGYNYAIYVKE